MAYQSNEKIIYDLCRSINKHLEGNVHIICTYDDPDHHQYRVYFKNSYYFSVTREVYDFADEHGDTPLYNYDIDTEWWDSEKTPFNFAQVIDLLKQIQLDVITK